MTAKVIIGVDPHKTAHTAVAVDDKESHLAKLEVRANASQLKRLLAWAEPFGGADAGDRGLRRVRLPARPAARRCRRTRP